MKCPRLWPEQWPEERSPDEERCEASEETDTDPD